MIVVMHSRLCETVTRPKGHVSGFRCRKSAKHHGICGEKLDKKCVVCPGMGTRTEDGELWF
jgi:hypothetical protein